MKKMLFIMNPYAGMRKANRYLADILTVFNRAGFAVTVHMTAGPGDCQRITTLMAKYADLVVCAGGDGTFSEMVNGLIKLGLDIPVGYIPCGSTNNFANTLHLSKDPLQAARDIVEGQSIRYDVGQFGERYFTYVASFGAFTRASYATPQNIKNALGHAAYILGGIQELSQLHKEHVRIETEDQIIDDDFLFGAICNSTSVGGILTLDPKQVDMADGKFELLLVRAPKDILEVSECLSALQSKKYNCAMVTFLSTSHLKISANPEMSWTLDGEHADGAAEITITNLQHAIRVMTRSSDVQHDPMLYHPGRPGLDAPPDEKEE
ncbi:MAG: diacylglycerol kinase family lipid kinase [Oscillospiraceae bacterium]|nr:diacylglycerol kinase family lipid kinase [Oscillospiraceae bacterium]